MIDEEKDGLNAEETADEYTETSETEKASEKENISEDGEKPEEDPAAALEAKIKALEESAAADKDKYLRLLAEYDNFRKRSVKERLDADATAKAALEVISVIDNFERAMAAECSDESYKKGVEMIYGQFTEVIKKLGVEEIEALGKEFDPNLHNAVSQVEDESFGESTVSQVYQKGYKLGDKVIRCAMVVVANP